MNVFVDRWWPATEIPGQIGEASGAWEHQLQPESAGQQDEDCPEMAAAESDDQGPALCKKIFDIRHCLKSENMCMKKTLYSQCDETTVLKYI